MFISDVTNIESRVRELSVRTRQRLQSVGTDLYSIATIVFIFFAIAISALVEFVIENVRSVYGDEKRVRLRNSVSLAKSISVKARSLVRSRE